ncbi:DUF5996 family protein [Sphingomonas sp. GB1N7]|uniref:DUF5996 family protein n=1 Tax=Parasphingomonas caseinilytica TaxID=3096158 RepID=UPI002FCCB286
MAALARDIALQLRTQIVGKIRLALTPWLNHSWHVPLYVSARGLTTSPIRLGARILEIEFDFLADSLTFRTSDGEERCIPLAAGRIADFHAAVLVVLADLDVEVTIDGSPSEMLNAVPFAEDHVERPYDGDTARDFWHALIQATRVFDDFRTGFLGKASPTHFFWGSFDLASTRFSGRTAPRHPGGVPGLPDAVTVEAYSDQESSLGFWPGSDAYPHPAFYAYAWPAPAGYAEARVAPDAAHYDADLGEFILPYNAVRTASDPDAALLSFCRSTYDAAADLGEWDRGSLECPLGRPRVPRTV